MMNQAVVKMCDDWGVPKENVRSTTLEVNPKLYIKTDSEMNRFFFFNSC